MSRPPSRFYEEGEIVGRSGCDPAKDGRATRHTFLNKEMKKILKSTLRKVRNVRNIRNTSRHLVNWDSI